MRQSTLDPTLRTLKLPDGRPAILSDTVGFIRDMPKDLFAAFRATFEEAADADLLLEIVDASSNEIDEHLQATQGLLESLGLGHIPRLLVRNKIDCLSEDLRDTLFAAGGSPEADTVCLSARNGTGLAELIERMAACLPQPPPWAVPPSLAGS